MKTETETEDLSPETLELARCIAVLEAYRATLRRPDVAVTIRVKAEIADAIRAKPESFRVYVEGADGVSRFQRIERKPIMMPTR